MKPYLRSLAAFLFVLGCGDPPADDPLDAAVVPPDADTGDGFEVVGHAALDSTWTIGLTIAGDHAYTGERFGGGIAITDISDPTAPALVGHAETSTLVEELHAIEDLQRLYALQAEGGNGWSLVVFDLSTPTDPQVAGRYAFPAQSTPHELFLWRDPADASRVLAFVSDVGSNQPRSLHVLDVSDPTAITARFVAAGAASHSASVSADGRRVYLSLMWDGLAVMDAAEIVGTAADPAGTMLTAASDRLVDCTPTSATCITHSAVEVPGRDLVVLTYENQGCPKGWMNLADVSDPARPALRGSWRHPKYELCNQDEPFLGVFGYGPHNPTVTANLALVSWYRAGLIAFDLGDPDAPTPVATFEPDVPDPELSQTWGKVAAVSYPIVRDGLIYLLDGQTGLYILRYHGPHADELASDAFLEGNSNL